MRTTARRLGIAVAGIALLMSGTGCSRSSDSGIIRALTVRAEPVVARIPTAPVTSQPVQAIPAPVDAAVATAAEPSATPSKRAGKPADAASPSAAGKFVRAATPAPSAVVPAVSGPASGSEIKFGQVGTFSGVIGAVTSYAPKVLAAWAAATNAHGGLKGHRVKILVGDDQGDPATGLTFTKRMVESDGAMAMVANANVFGLPQIEQYTREKGIPLIGGDGVDPLWNTSPNSFPVQTSVLNQSIIGLKTLLARGGTRIGVLYCVEISQLCSYMTEGAKKSAEVGSKIVETAQVSMVAPSYTSQCLRMKQAGVDVLYVGLDGAGAARAARDCAAQGYRPQIMLMSVCVTPDSPRVGTLDGALIPSGVVPTAATGIPALDRYRQVMATYAPGLGDSGLGSLAWAAGELLRVAFRNLPANPTSADLYAGLWSVRNETLGGLTVPLTFAKGIPPQTGKCMFLWGLGGGHWTAPAGPRPQC